LEASCTEVLIFYYSPVCGTDGKTYSNSSKAGCQNMDIGYEGVCKEESSLSSIPFFSVILVLSFLAYERRWSDLIKK